MTYLRFIRTYTYISVLHTRCVRIRQFRHVLNRHTIVRNSSRNHRAIFNTRKRHTLRVRSTREVIRIRNAYRQHKPKYNSCHRQVTRRIRRFKRLKRTYISNLLVHANRHRRHRNVKQSTNRATNRVTRCTVIRVTMRRQCVNVNSLPFKHT